MFPILDVITTLGGLIVPPAFNFITKKFVKEENDTPERTIGALATTNPETVPAYVEALCKYLNAQGIYFNRDVVGEVSLWIRNLRAAIRPMSVICSLGILGVMAGATLFGGYTPPSQEAADLLTGIRLSCEGVSSSWMGSRLSLKN